MSTETSHPVKPVLSQTDMESSSLDLITWILRGSVTVLSLITATVLQWLIAETWDGQSCWVYLTNIQRLITINTKAQSCASYIHKTLYQNYYSPVFFLFQVTSSKWFPCQNFINVTYLVHYNHFYFTTLIMSGQLHVYCTLHFSLLLTYLLHFMDAKLVRWHQIHTKWNLMLL